MYTYTCIHIYVCMNVHIYIYTYRQMYIIMKYSCSMYEHIYIHMYNMYAHIYIHVHVIYTSYKHIHVYFPSNLKDPSKRMPKALTRCVNSEKQGPLKVGLEILVLARELEQHRVVEEFVDGNILAHALAAPRLDHEFAREIVCGLWLEGTQHDRLVEGVSRYDRPMIEHLQAEGLALCVCTQIRLKAKGVNHGNVGLNRVQGRAGFGQVLGDVAASARQDSVDR
mmetsp:Transcript_54176/g.87699  ORF Transcript_54176/g.87699 Transcript_54176/m.87699 type:complete len:224 (-) Transcript_54176:2686-3357(-)